MFRQLSLFCAFLTFCLLVTGAYARIADAGLGCPDWPGCYGGIVADIVPAPAGGEAVSASPLAVAHRYGGGALVLLVAILAVSAGWVRQRRIEALGLSWLALILVGLQAAAGQWGGELLQRPLVMVLQLLAGLLSAGLLYAAYLTQRPQAQAAPAGNSGLRWMARLGFAFLLAQIILGWWTSITGAGLACPDFPTCLGSYNPPVDYETAFELPLGKGLEFQGGTLSFSARAAIHWSHRVGAVIVFLWLSLLAMRVSSNRRAPGLSKAGVLMSFLLLVQVSLGVGAVLLRLPVAIAVAHSAVAALLLLNVLHILVFLRVPRLEEHPLEAALAPARREALEALPEVALPPQPVPAPVVEVPVPPPSEGLFDRLKSGLGKTRGGLTGFLANLALGKKAIDRNLLEDIEAQLLMADIGVTATAEIIADLTNSLERSQLDDVGVLTARLRDHLYQLLEPCSLPLQIPPDRKPFVILVVGVNGVGKTTTIGKLARRLQNQGHSVMLAAGDTFRAAAVEQLQTWGERNNIPVIAQHTGADSASVIFDAVQSAQSRGVDVLIADTAGRLHTKSNLMEELSKIKRIMGKLDPTAPHEVLLVLDAGTGQNALSQAKQFNEAVGLTGLAITKLDGTAKGGVIFALAKQFGIPIRYIGVGESIDDLQDFDARKFIDALFATE
ncbi:MAG: signal recognition particle-docking protein FtsY [Proteobacteria bacterium]|nr:signal recognition particle-docking protein FtsY [Pseudomonadota bacterium]